MIKYSFVDWVWLFMNIYKQLFKMGYFGQLLLFIVLGVLHLYLLLHIFRLHCYRFTFLNISLFYIYSCVCKFVLHEWLWLFLIVCELFWIKFTIVSLLPPNNMCVKKNAVLPTISTAIIYNAVPSIARLDMSL